MPCRTPGCRAAPSRTRWPRSGSGSAAHPRTRGCRRWWTGRRRSPPCRHTPCWWPHPAGTRTETPADRPARNSPGAMRRLLPRTGCCLRSAPAGPPARAAGQPRTGSGSADTPPRTRPGPAARTAGRRRHRNRRCDRAAACRATPGSPPPHDGTRAATRRPAGSWYRTSQSAPAPHRHTLPQRRPAVEPVTMSHHHPRCRSSSANAAAANRRMLAGRSDDPVSSVTLASAGPASPKQAWPAASP
jgi:hypothetical protein